MKTKDITSLKIHQLSTEQYNRIKTEGNIDETAIYLTPLTPYYTDINLDEVVFITVDEIDEIWGNTGYNKKR